MRLGDRRQADRHPSRGHDGPGHAQRRAGQTGQKRPGRGGRYSLLTGHADGLQHLKIRRRGRRVPGDGLADEEQGRDERRKPERQQAGGLVGRDPADRVTEVHTVVPHVDVVPPSHPGQGSAERGDGGLASLEPDQRVDVDLAARAHDVGPVPGKKGVRRDDAAGRAWSVGADIPRAADHSGDARPDPRPGRCPGGPVVALIGLPQAGQFQRQRVPHMLTGGRGELGRDDDFINAVRVEQPPGQDDRALDGPGHLVVGDGERAALRRIALRLEPERDGEPGQRGHVGQGRDPGPVEPRLVGQDGDGRGERAGPQPVPGAFPPAGARDRGQDGRGGQRDEQGQDGQRPPPPARVQAQPSRGHQHRPLPWPSARLRPVTRPRPPTPSMGMSRRPTRGRLQGCRNDQSAGGTPTQDGVVASRTGHGGPRPVGPRPGAGRCWSWHPARSQQGERFTNWRPISCALNRADKRGAVNLGAYGHD